MKRLLASVLALVMVLSVCLMAGCNDVTETTTGTKKPAESSTTTADKGGEETTASTPTQGGEETTAPQQGGEETTTANQGGEEQPTTWDGYTKRPGYEDVTFRGATFNILGTKGGNDTDYNNEQEVYSEGTDAISVAANERVRVIEQRYDCDIVFIGSPTPATIFTAATTGGEKVDLYAPTYQVKGMAESGSWYNLASLDIDLTANYWNQNYVNTYKVKNSAGVDCLYNVVGDFALFSYTSTYCLMFNSKAYANMLEAEFGSIYDLVRENKWTMDVFAQMLAKGSNDADGNSNYSTDEGDIVGWVSTGHATNALVFASGLPLIANENGKLTYALSKNVAQWDSVISKAIEIWALPYKQSLGNTAVTTAFLSGNAVFYGEVLACLGRDELTSAENMEVSIVPYPKYSESQENYAHYVDNHMLAYGIPASVANVDEVADFFSIYAAHSTAILRPAFIDAYSYDYLAGAESAEMLEIVLDSRVFDPGYLCWNSLLGDMTGMISSGKNNTAQIITRRENTYAGDSGELANFIKNIDDNQT